MISLRQRKEIAFLEELSKQSFSKKDIEKYFDYTVNGKGIKPENNPVYQARRKIDIAIKEWKEDVAEGLITPEEIIAGFKNKEYLESINWNKKHQRNES
jgi:hypothetical protein